MPVDAQCLFYTVGSVIYDPSNIRTLYLMTIVIGTMSSFISYLALQSQTICHLLTFKLGYTVLLIFYRKGI